MSAYNQLQLQLAAQPLRWLVTGVAGFIGSHLLERLLALNQTVTGLDNFSTGHKHNLDDVQAALNPDQWSRFRFIEGSICDPSSCELACSGAQIVLHQAALGSVPRSISDPLSTHAANASGFINILVAARKANVQRLVYASSSAVYGDHPDLPKLENRTGNPLSPYAATKAINELYADVFARAYTFPSIGLRYFNVFGPRQDPNGAYAAVIPKWVDALLNEQPVHVNGDGETSRDFCFIENVVQANLLAARAINLPTAHEVFNIAVGERTSLNQLLEIITKALQPHLKRSPAKPVHDPFRPGDVRHSLADISKARTQLGFEPTVRVTEGIQRAIDWYRHHSS
jgi:UDP-N-acetylglucosamine 4-epimerase